MERLLMLLAGIDEAGRGCVIGPMVLCGVSVDNRRHEELVRLGVRDSKELTPQARQELADRLPPLLERISFRDIPPEDLDRTSLNALSFHASLQITAELGPARVWVDAPVHPRGVDGYARKMRQVLALTPSLRSTEVVAENYADANYPVVSAASILAKVRRDNIIRQLHLQYGDFGSGYPSDPKTRIYLENSYREFGSFPPIVRRKWKTCQRIMAHGLPRLL